MGEERRHTRTAAAPPRLTLPLIGLVVLLGVVILLAVLFGATNVSWSDPSARAIIFQLRLPRALLAALVGAILAVAGVTFQTVLRNPLADPFILGVSGGAACAAAVVSALGLAHVPGLVPLMAFAGACASTAAVFVLARRRDHTDPTRLLISGLVLNAFFSAVILLAFALAPQSDLTAALRWMMGSLFGASWSDVAVCGVLLIAAAGVLAVNANDMRMMAFGEDDAKSRGVDVERVKLIALGAASLITGAAVAVSGIIGFVGLLVPHLIRLIWRRDFRALLPLCALGGATLLVAGDLVSRIILPPVELPLSAFTAILGVPFFLSLLRRAR